MLAFFGIRDLRRQRVEPCRGKVFPDGVTGQAQRPRVDHQHLANPLSQ